LKFIKRFAVLIGKAFYESNIRKTSENR
jgi:hypothetical protein